MPSHENVVNWQTSALVNLDLLVVRMTFIHQPLNNTPNCRIFSSKFRGGSIRPFVHWRTLSAEFIENVRHLG